MSPGTRLGPYEIVAPIGAGGMGEVYRARDTKLNRDVAIKVLPAAFAHDPDRLVRFQREAQALAALNHPNIAAIYGLEEHNGAQHLVMEYIAGESPRGPMPVDEALNLAKQLADALEAAHDKGIVHRDLKPDNLKVTPEGTLKVLDFGLAKAVEETSQAELSHSPTMSAAATRAGVMLGTAGYMSPEQARGKSVDRRADIWAFGCVLYEWLTGKKAFPGETVTDSTVAIMTAEPLWSALPPGSPLPLLRRCLQKDPRQRLRNIGDAQWEIEDRPVAAPQPPVPQRKSPLWIWPAAILSAVAIFAAGMWMESRREPATPTWTATRLSSSGAVLAPRLSPDGKLLAFQTLVGRQSQMAVMNPETGNGTVLTHDLAHGEINNHSWSPDGSRIYFGRDVGGSGTGVFSVPALGGETKLLLENAIWPEALPDGSIVVVRLNDERRNQFYRLWPANGRLEALDAEGFACHPSADGSELIYFGHPHSAGAAAKADLFVLDLKTGLSRRVGRGLPVPDIQPGTFAVTRKAVLIGAPDGDAFGILEIALDGRTPTRTILHVTSVIGGVDVGPDGSLYFEQNDRPSEALRFAPGGGTPEVLLETRRQMFVASESSRPAPVELSGGRMLFASVRAGRRVILSLKEGGDPEPFIETPEDTAWPVAAVGEREFAFVLGSGADRIVAIASQTDGRIIRRLDPTRGLAVASVAASPDGKTIYYVADGTLWSMPATGGKAQKITTADSVAPDPNGRDLIVSRVQAQSTDLFRVPLDGGKEIKIPVPAAYPLGTNFLSPNAVGKDGRIAFGVETADSWWDEPVILDPRTGKAEKLRVPYTGDIDTLGWSRDGHLLASGLPMRTSLWRFRPEKPNK